MTTVFLPFSLSVGFSPFSLMTSHKPCKSLHPQTLPSALPLRQVPLLKTLSLVTCRFPRGKEMGFGHSYSSRLSGVNMSCQQLHQCDSPGWFSQCWGRGVHRQEWPVAPPPSCLEDFGDCFPSRHHVLTEERTGWLACTLRAWRVTLCTEALRCCTEAWEDGDTGSARLVGGLRGSRKYPGTWVIWTTDVLGVLEGCETLEIPYSSLLPAGSPQSGLSSPVEVCGVGVWPQKCCWVLCCDRVDPFSDNGSLKGLCSYIAPSLHCRIL